MAEIRSRNLRKKEAQRTKLATPTTLTTLAKANNDEATKENQLDTARNQPETSRNQPETLRNQPSDPCSSMEKNSAAPLQELKVNVEHVKLGTADRRSFVQTCYLLSVTYPFQMFVVSPFLITHNYHLPTLLFFFNLLTSQFLSNEARNFYLRCCSPIILFSITKTLSPFLLIRYVPTSFLFMFGLYLTRTDIRIGTWG